MSVQAQKILVGLLSLVLFVALAIAGGIDRSRRPQMAPDSAAVAAFTNPQFARGREVYAKYSCNACHGAAGKGGIRNLNAESGGQINGLLKVNESYSSKELAEKIRNGVTEVGKGDPTGPEPPLHMPAYRELISGQEMTDLVAYLMALSPRSDKPGGGW